MASSCAANQVCRPATVIGSRGVELAMRPVEGERLEGVGVDALDVAHLDQLLAERRVLARQPVGEVRIGHQAQQMVAHAVMWADLLLEQVFIGTPV
jgi:hypothetical protein